MVIKIQRLKLGKRVERRPNLIYISNRTACKQERMLLGGLDSGRQRERVKVPREGPRGGAKAVCWRGRELGKAASGRANKSREGEVPTKAKLVHQT